MDVTKVASGNMPKAHLALRDLPTEIWTKVFAYATIGSACRRSLRNTRRVDILVVIPSVCRRWRKLALSIPSLWSHVDLSKGNPELRSHLKGALLWIQRAQGTILHVHITDRWGTTPGHILRVFSALEPHLARIGSVDFEPKGDLSLVRNVLDLLARSGASGSLRSLAVTDHTDYTDDWDYGCYGDYYDDYVEDPDLALKWPERFSPNLVDLQLRGLRSSDSPSWDKLMVILASSPSLQSLRLHINPEAPRTNDILPSVHLPNLQLLDLFGMFRDRISILLPALIPGPLPLDLRIYLPDDDHGAAAIQGLFQRSRVTCIYLKLYENHYLKRLESCLAMLPHIHTIFLDHSNIRSTFLKGAAQTVEALGLWAPGERPRDIYVSDPKEDGVWSGVPDFVPVRRIVLVNYPQTSVGIMHLRETFMKYAKTIAVGSGLDTESLEDWDNFVRKHNT